MTRLKKEHRIRQILLAAFELSQDVGVYKITLDVVAKRVECSRPTVIRYFRSAEGLRRAVIKEAIEREDLAIMGEALFYKDPATDGIPTSIRNRAINVYVGRRVNA